MLVTLCVAVHTADIPARCPAVRRRTIHIAMALIDNEARAVEAVVIARSSGNRTFRGCVVQCGRMFVISADISTRGRRIADVRFTIALTVDGMMGGRTVTRVVVAPAVDEVAAKVLTRVRGINGRPKIT